MDEHGVFLDLKGSSSIKAGDTAEADLDLVVPVVAFAVVVDVDLRWSSDVCVNVNLCLEVSVLEGNSSECALRSLDIGSCQSFDLELL